MNGAEREQATAVRRDPFSMLRQLFSPESEESFWPLREAYPRADLFESEGALQLFVDLPGVSPQEIGLEIRGERIVIEGERRQPPDTQGQTTVRTERRMGRFSRSVPLPTNVIEDQVQARYQDGVLIIHMPKAQPTRRRTVQIST